MATLLKVASQNFCWVCVCHQLTAASYITSSNDFGVYIEKKNLKRNIKPLIGRQRHLLGTALFDNKRRNHQKKIRKKSVGRPLNQKQLKNYFYLKK